MDDRELLEQIRPLIGRKETADDCAAFPLDDGRILVSSTDMLHETTDFPKGMTDYEIGWMSVAITLSDIASCGAQPVQVLIATGLDNPKRLYQITCGACDCAKKYGATISGGDIDSHKELTIVTTAFGIVSKEDYKTRSGANPGDLICVTGIPGRAQAALDRREEFRSFLLTPIPQVNEGIKIAKKATAMMDVSDGVAISLYDLAESSGVGVELDSHLFHLFEQTEYAMKCYLFGGGDFGLLFTLPPKTTINGVEYTIIGKISEKPGVYMDGKELPKKGYAHVFGEDS